MRPTAPPGTGSISAARSEQSTHSRFLFRWIECFQVTAKKARLQTFIALFKEGVYS
jgi:hypothetical protein